MTALKWPDNPALALTMPNTNVYIDGSGSMARNLANGLSAFKYAVAWASKERRGFQRLYAYNQLDVRSHHRNGFGDFPHAGDGSYLMLNHAEEQKRRFVVITDDPQSIARELAQHQHRLGRWALVVVGTDVTTGGVVDVMGGPNAPGKAYTLPEPNALRERKLAPNSAAQLADSMARASRAAVEGNRTVASEGLLTDLMPREQLLGPVSPAISEAHNDPELARSYMETLAEAFVALNTDQPHDYDYPRELAEQIVEAKQERQKREREKVVLVALKELGVTNPLYERAILHYETPEATAHLSRLWRSLKPVHDFVKEALGE